MAALVAAYALRAKPSAMVAAIVSCVAIVAASFAPWLAPQDPFDPSGLDLLNSHLPPAWLDGGQREFLLGTDKQGRDILSGILFGLRTSLIVGFGAVILSATVGAAVGLAAGFLGGRWDALLMRIAEVQFAFPPILVVLVLSGVLRASIGPEAFGRVSVAVLVVGIGLANWIPFARVARASTLVERGKDYVLAGRVTGFGAPYLLRRHLLPNIIGPLLVLAVTQIAVSVIYEATLSFLGLGTPPTQPSLGALIFNGSQYLFSGVWWVIVFPGGGLLVLLLALTVFGDCVRDATNPRLR